MNINLRQANRFSYKWLCLFYFSHTESHTTRSKASQTHINGTTQVTSATSNHQFQPQKFPCQHRLFHFKSTRDNFLKRTFCFNPKGKEVVSTHFQQSPERIDPDTLCLLCFYSINLESGRQEAASQGRRHIAIMHARFFERRHFYSV